MPFNAKTHENITNIGEFIGEISYPGGEIQEVSCEGLSGYVIEPTEMVDEQRRWVWIAPMWLGLLKDEQNPLEIEYEHQFYIESLLERGFHVVGIGVGATLGSVKGARVFDSFYDLVTEEFDLHPKARLIGQSNGGLIVYAWAFRNPERVNRILGTCPSLDLLSWPGFDAVVEEFNENPLAIQLSRDELERRLPELNPIDNLDALADAGVHIFHIHGAVDDTVPFEPNSGEALRRYRELGGEMELKALPDVGHDPGPGLYDSEEAVAFLTV